MADKKISALTAATTPLAGTEVLPIVQGGSTVKVSIADVTAGRTVNAANLVLSGDAAIGTSITAGIKLGLRGAQTSTVIGCDNGVNTGFVVKFSPSLTDIGNDFAQPLGFLVNNVQQAKLESNGNFTANLGNLVIGTTAKGITTGSAIPLGFGVNNSVSAMTIDTSSNVGVGTTSPTTGSMSNGAILNAGVFATLKGSVASTSGVAVTIAVANQNHAQATYIVSVGISSAAPTVYSAVAIVSADNNALRSTTLQIATLMTISVSGTDIQATQTSGGAATILYTITRVA